MPIVYAGNLIYRFHRATAPSLIKHFRDCIKGVPRELYANVLLTAGPANQDSLVVIQMCYLGPKEEGQKYLDAIASWDGERCLLNEVNEKSFLNQQDSVAQILRGKGPSSCFPSFSLPSLSSCSMAWMLTDTPTRGAALEQPAASGSSARHSFTRSPTRSSTRPFSNSQTPPSAAVRSLPLLPHIY